MAKDGQKPWYIRRGGLLITISLFVTLTVYVLLTPVVLFGATLYSRFCKNKWLAALAAKGAGAFWLTAAEKKEFASLSRRIAEYEVGQAGEAVPASLPEADLAKVRRRYADLCAAPARRRARFMREYGLAYGAPAGLITWLIAIVLYSFEFSKGIFESFFFYFHFPVRILTRTMLDGELWFVLSMSTTALAVALITSAFAGLMARRLAGKLEPVTPENYLRYGDAI